ncbi:Flagellar assembly protein FliH [Sulfitobacter marinus]|uniref:Flagellar assembly protein FliH n=1 Tax=Sulfitobacter marinus TaxID=394264 RepID=A0A1I6V4Y7_9RHOB|nr:FliH/SctL family protein [Sulfitobacter marinus]SFT08743.1 Flagellar assembly protein FliH [Sulfitobacter marinus]
MISRLNLRNFDDDGSSTAGDPDAATNEEIEARIAKAHKQGHIEGYLTGADAGRAEMAKTMEKAQTEMVEMLAQELARLAIAAEQRHEALVAQVVGFTLQTCEIIFPEIIERMSAERVRKTAMRSLKMAIGSSRIRVRLSPDTLAEIGPELRMQAAQHQCDHALELQADPELHAGDARMEWDHGGLDYGFQKICDRLLAELRDTHQRAINAQKDKDGHGQA